MVNKIQNYSLFIHPVMYHFLTNILLFSTENELYRSCDPLQSAINRQTTGNDLRIRFRSANELSAPRTGFVLVKKVKVKFHVLTAFFHKT